MLCVIDQYTRECLAIRVKRKFNSRDVLDTLAEQFVRHGAPEHICFDKGLEFIATAYRCEDALHRTGEPMGEWLLREIGFACLRPNSKLRDELLARETSTTSGRPSPSSKPGAGTTKPPARTFRSDTVPRRREPSCPRRLCCLTVRRWRHERRY